MSASPYRQNFGLKGSSLIDILIPKGFEYIFSTYCPVQLRVVGKDLNGIAHKVCNATSLHFLLRHKVVEIHREVAMRYNRPS